MAEPRSSRSRRPPPLLCAATYARQAAGVTSERSIPPHHSTRRPIGGWVNLLRPHLLGNDVVQIDGEDIAYRRLIDTTLSSDDDVVLGAEMIEELPFSFITRGLAAASAELTSAVEDDPSGCPILGGWSKPKAGWQGCTRHRSIMLRISASVVISLLTTRQIVNLRWSRLPGQFGG